MNLSMWEIYNSLNYEQIVPMIQSGQATIEQARLIASSYLNEKTVYVGRAINYFESSEEDTLIVHRDDMILVRGVDTENVFNEICSIMETYDSWESTLASLVDQEDGMQHMVDASKSVLKAPCFVYAPDGHAFAISNGYSSDIHWHWAEILAHGGISSDRMRELRDSINLPEVWKDRYPKSRPSQMGDHCYLHCSLYPNGYMAGHLVLFGFERPFDEGLERIVNILVKYITRHMEAYYAMYSPTSKLAESFAGFFVSKSFDVPETVLPLRALNWNLEDTYRLFVIRERDVRGPVLLSRLYATVAKQFILSVAFIFEESLIIVENETRQRGLELSLQMESLLKDDFCCGISVAFNDLRKFHSYYLQAKNEVERCVAQGTSISDAACHRDTGLLDVLSENELILTYAARECLDLKKYDEDNGTDYYQTLRAYVLASFHCSDAARYLGIHRNSLTYRLEKIRELIDFDAIDRAAATHDASTVNYYLLSFAIIDASF